MRIVRTTVIAIAIAASFAIGWLANTPHNTPTNLPDGGVTVMAICPHEDSLWENPDACRIVITPRR